MRVHLHQCYMTFEEADKVQYYLQSLPGVKRAKVSERTCDATVYYGGTAKQRQRLIHALSNFDYETTQVSVPDHTGRELNHEFEDRMSWHIAGRFVTRWFLPVPIRSIISFVKAIPFVIRGLKSLFKGRIDVHVLDAASVTFAIARADFDTASSVMFLLGIGDIMEEWTHRKVGR